MKKSILFLFCSVIALGISLSACAQLQTDHEPQSIVIYDDQGKVSAVRSVSFAGPVNCNDLNEIALPFDRNITGVDDLEIYSSLNYQTVTLDYRPDDIEMMGLDEPLIEYTEQVPLNESIEQMPLNESMQPMIPQYYHEYGEIQGNQWICMYMVPISRKEAKRLIKQMHTQAKSDTGKRPPGENYLVRL